jgi:enoyl-CoA hydratase
MSILEVEQLGKIRRLTLNRPEKRNALSRELLEALSREIDSAADDQNTFAVIIRGSGAAFCAGYDISPRPGIDLWSDRERLKRAARTFEVLWQCPIPIIASVHGACVAGGGDLAMHCDLMIAAKDARIGYPGVRNLGVPPTNMWIYRLGPQIAMRLFLTGDSMTGAQAGSLGLAAMICDAPDLDRVAIEFAERLTNIGREILIGNKNVINRCIDMMGRPVLNHFAASEDAIAHTSPAVAEFRATVRDRGVRQAVRDRDEKFNPEPPIAHFDWPK